MRPRHTLLLLAGLLLGASAPLLPEPHAPLPEPVGLANLLGTLFPCLDEVLDLDPPELLDDTDLAILHDQWDPPP